MKFDVVIGNPPYQVSDGGAQASAKPVYNLFVQAAKKLNVNYLSFIIPARFFTGGKGLDDFREEMIHDKDIRTLNDYANSADCFSGVDIKGGVCHFIWEKGYNNKCKCIRHDDFGISKSERYLVEEGDDIFIRENFLVSIKNKVKRQGEKTFDLIASPAKLYGLRGDAIKSRKKYNLPEMYDTPIKNGYRLFGLDEKLKRIYKYLPANYPFERNEGLNKYKVFISESYGCGEIGEIPATPVLATPGELCTETFIQIGPFDTQEEAKHCLKYIKTKFLRALVGIRKQTQHATRTVYKYVPLQDFTSKSDIDWSKSIKEIDQQLYKKYGLDENEINFIETRVKEMA